MNPFSELRLKPLCDKKLNMKYYIFTFLLLFSFTAQAQKSYNKEIKKHRKTYKKDFLKSDHSPLLKKDMKSLRFYKAKPEYRVTADFKRTPDAEEFAMATVSGKNQAYIKHGTVIFILNGETLELAVYRSLRLAQMPQYRDHLFMPFNDQTNGNETYGGGRYLDLKASDIKDGKVVLDFNKVYNPYCAYSGGYSCPIPPQENKLDFAIEAGEKEFTGVYKGEH